MKDIKLPILANLLESPSETDADSLALDRFIAYWDIN
jgi:hypothetical protein